MAGSGEQDFESHPTEQAALDDGGHAIVSAYLSICLLFKAKTIECREKGEVQDGGSPNTDAKRGGGSICAKAKRNHAAAALHPYRLYPALRRPETPRHRAVLQVEKYESESRRQSGRTIGQEPEANQPADFRVVLTGETEATPEPSRHPRLSQRQRLPGAFHACDQNREHSNRRLAQHFRRQFQGTEISFEEENNTKGTRLPRSCNPTVAVLRSAKDFLR